MRTAYAAQTRIVEPNGFREWFRERLPQAFRRLPGMTTPWVGLGWEELKTFLPSNVYVRPAREPDHRQEGRKT